MALMTREPVIVQLRLSKQLRAYPSKKVQPSVDVVTFEISRWVTRNMTQISIGNRCMEITNVHSQKRRSMYRVKQLLKRKLSLRD